MPGVGYLSHCADSVALVINTAAMESQRTFMTIPPGSSLSRRTERARICKNCRGACAENRKFKRGVQCRNRCGLDYASEKAAVYGRNTLLISLQPPANLPKICTMKITVALAVIIAASLSVQGAMAQDQASTPNSAATGSIEGVALQTDTNEPIAGSNVTLSSPWLSVRSRQTKTDDQGKFSFTGLEAGTYGLSFSGLPYVRQAYGQKTFPGSGMALVLTNGQSIKALVMHLMRTGAMTGRVQDPAGKPLSAIPVHILKSVYDANGKRTFQDSGKTTTDDRGVYRI